MSVKDMEIDDMPEMSRSSSSVSTLFAESMGDEDENMEKAQTAPISVFDRVTAELLKIGAIPLEKFATEENPLDVPHQGSLAPDTPHVNEAAMESGMAIEEDGTVKGTGKEHFEAIAKIYGACKNTFESSEAIEFHYKEDVGPNAIECILTITLPDGRKRSYTSGPHYSKRTDAKAQASSRAVSMGAIDFIKYGDIDPKAHNATIVETLDVPGRLKAEDGKGVSFVDQKETKVNDENVQAISDCCIEWRAGTVKPVYIHFSEPTVMSRAHGKKVKSAAAPTEDELLALKQGCALKIGISQHTTRVYSVHHIYQTRAQAKVAVAAVAIKQGVIDFIRHANGQKTPLKIINELEGDTEENLNRDIINKTNEPAKEVTIEATAVNVSLKKHQIPLNAMTLHAFSNSLPKPFPETPGLKPIGEGNPVGWLNAAVQSARGSKMTLTWTYLSNARLSLHGCLLRFNLPRVEEGRSYLVEPQFTKRSDAKSAVSLLAISQNVGGWIREISLTIENLITPDMRTKAASLIGLLYQECTRARICQPIYLYTHEDGAVGCTLRIEFSLELWREYTVPVQYRAKPDSRLAAVLQAYHEGVLEFIRFRGEDPPPGYNPELPHDWKMTRMIENAQKQDKNILSVAERVEYNSNMLARDGTCSRPEGGDKFFGRDGTLDQIQVRGRGPWNAGSAHDSLGYAARCSSNGSPQARFPIGQQGHQHHSSDSELSVELDLHLSRPRPRYMFDRAMTGCEMREPTGEAETIYDKSRSHSLEYDHPRRPTPTTIPSQENLYHPSQYPASEPPPPVDYRAHRHSTPNLGPRPLPPYSGPAIDAHASPAIYPFSQSPFPPPYARDTQNPYTPQSYQAYPRPSYEYLSSPYGYENYTRRSGFYSHAKDSMFEGKAGFASTTSQNPGCLPPSDRDINNKLPNQRPDFHGGPGTRKQDGRHEDSSRDRRGSTSIRVSNLGIGSQARQPEHRSSHPGSSSQTSISKTVNETGKHTCEVPSTQMRLPRGRSKQCRQQSILLIEYCEKRGMKQPLFKHEQVESGEYKVWIVVDKERFSLAQTFKDVSTGTEEVAGKILSRLQGSAKKRRYAGDP